MIPRNVHLFFRFCRRNLRHHCSALGATLLSVMTRAGFRRPMQWGMWLLLAILTAALSLEFGLWKESESFRGPFRSDRGTLRSYVLQLRRVKLDEILLDKKADERSDLRLWINGEPWGPPHTPRDVMGEGGTRAFSHRGNWVYFALPDEITNSSDLEATVTYSVKLRAKVLIAIGLVAATLIWMRGFVAYRAGKLSRFAAQWRCAVGVILYGASWVVIGTSAFYAGSIVYGFVIGDPLPTATLLRHPSFEWLVALEPFVGIGLLAFAGLGVLLARIGAWEPTWRDSMQQTERALSRLWYWCGLPVILCVLLLAMSSGGWSGHIRLMDRNYVSLAGQIPYSDANNYFTAALEQTIFGEWNAQAARRPLAAAFRQVTVWAGQIPFGWNIYLSTLLVQVGLIAVLLAVAARCILEMYGIWAGIAFTGAIYALGREYLLTTMTEPLGLAWALVAIVAFGEAFRLRSPPHALVALAALTLALWTRMGSLLTLPFLALWIAFAFARSWSGRARLFFLACVVFIAVIALNTLLALSYGPPGVLTGGNFAYTVCGLAQGASWDACYNSYKVQLSSLTEQEQAWFLLAKAWESFRQHPGVLFEAVLTNLRQFIAESAPTLMTGGVTENRLKASWLASLALVPGFAYALKNRTSYPERSFWLSLLVSAALSAAIILKDGRRAMLVTDALMAWFLALGFTAPAVVTQRDDSVARWRSQTGLAVLAAIAAIFFLVPSFSRALSEREIASHGAVGPFTENEHILLGGGRISGFLVIADEADASSGVPALPWSKFVDLIEMTRLEDEFGPFLKDVSDKTPFAFVTGVLLTKPWQQLLYIAPVEVIEQRDAWAWRLTLVPGQPNSSPLFRRVLTAEKVP
jgi:hypothetical protein